MNSMEHEYRELCSGRWAEMNPSKCPCRGRGFLISDLDTCHRCPIHGEGATHPEDERSYASVAEEEAESRAAEERYVNMMRGVFMHFANRALEVMGNKAAVMKAVKATRTGSTPQDFVDAVERVAMEAEYEAEERSAQARGFSCGLEARMENEAMWERKEAGLDF